MTILGLRVQTSNMAEASTTRDEEDEGDNHWAQLAKKYWPKAVKSRKTKPDVIKTEIWDVLEQQAFHFRSLLILENLQLLEKYASLGTLRDRH